MLRPILHSTVASGPRAAVASSPRAGRSPQHSSYGRRGGQPLRIAKTLLLTIGLFAALGLFAPPVTAQDLSKVGVVEHLGEYLPLDQLKFIDEDGSPIILKELFDRPIILTLVYYRCPGICTPLLQDLIRNLENCDLVPGVDYKIITISFDPDEKPELAKLKKANMLGEFKKKTMPPDAWRFFTGDEDNIRRITERVGFLYVRDRNEADFVHAGSLIFISTDGKIARYLNGTEFNPADVKMAVIDAAQGNVRSFMQKIQRLCYTYDPEGRAYVLKINRIILGVTLAFALVFGGFLVFANPRRKNKPLSDSTGNAS